MDDSAPKRNGRKPVDFDARLRLNSETGCLEWTAGRIRTGYGRLKVGGKLLLAHRFAFTRAYGPIPSGKYVCHKCDNPSCCNPEHLYIGDQFANMADRQAKGRYRGPAGETNGAAKLDAQSVKQIRKLYADGAKQKDLARMFGITQPNVSQIVLRKKWAHI